MTDKFTLIHAEKATHSVELMTRLLHVSRAGYYSWVKRGDTPGPAATRRAEVTAAVIDSHTASNGVNGHRRVRADLTADGVPASEGMVRSIMRQAGIAGIQPRTKKRTTIPADDAEQRPDLVKRDFTSDTPGTKLVGDITYLRTGEGWLFLATVIDLHSRMVVGWAMAEHMRTELISAALRMAHTHGHLVGCDTSRGQSLPGRNDETRCHRNAGSTPRSSRLTRSSSWWSLSGRSRRSRGSWRSMRARWATGSRSTGNSTLTR